MVHLDTPRTVVHVGIICLLANTVITVQVAGLLVTGHTVAHVDTIHHLVDIILTVHVAEQRHTHRIVVHADTVPTKVRVVLVDVLLLIIATSLTITKCTMMLQRPQ